MHRKQFLTDTQKHFVLSVMCFQLVFHQPLHLQTTISQLLSYHLIAQHHLYHYQHSIKILKQFFMIHWVQRFRLVRNILKYLSILYKVIV